MKKETKKVEVKKVKLDLEILELEAKIAPKLTQSSGAEC